MSSGIYQYSFPLPPSVNALWRTGQARMYRSKRYLAWLEECDVVFASKTVPRINYPFAIEIALGRPSKRKMDIDNRIKAVLDMLQRVGVIEDDCHAWNLNVYWQQGLDGCQVTLHKAAI